jgi:hypothetical protein
MLRVLLLVAAGLLAGASACGGTREPKAPSARTTHPVVVEVSTDKAEAWEAILTNVENLQRAFDGEPVDVEIVAHGGGLALLTKDNAPMAERIARFAGSGVVFVACENTMRKRNVTKEQLFPVVKTVPSGVAEVVRQQEAGRSFLKAGS